MCRGSGMGRGMGFFYLDQRYGCPTMGMCAFSVGGAEGTDGIIDAPSRVYRGKSAHHIGNGRAVGCALDLPAAVDYVCTYMHLRKGPSYMCTYVHTVCNCRWDPGRAAQYFNNEAA